jgi:diadenosine tetraphosphate (Ap4A) HIT family hydrolase
VARGFHLDPALASFAFLVGDLPLCQIRLANDFRYPWLILIPRVAHAMEIEQLDLQARLALIQESVLAGQAVRRLGAVLNFAVEKLNIGALGNVTRQLHVHVVGRRDGDPAWPRPVWGVGGDLPYPPTLQHLAISTSRTALGL